VVQQSIRKQSRSGVVHTCCLQLTDAVTARHVGDEGHVKQGLSKLSKMMEGTGLCLKASAWVKLPSQS
jgi:DNA gyrase inhibitor GyrI